MTNTIKNLAYLVVLAGFLGQACTQSNFTGSGAAKRASSDAKKDDGDDTDGKDADGKDADGKDADGKDTDDNGKTDSGIDEAGTGNLGDSGEECLARRAEFYNFMLIFDKSESQLRTDPNFVRRDGALAFVDRVYQYTQQYPQVKVYMSTMAFNQDSIRGTNGWQRLKDSSLQAIKADVTTATSNPTGNTSYSPVLKDAANFFDQINKTTNVDRTRNYVIFLTDGEPNALRDPGILGIPAAGVNEALADIPKAVDNLVKNFGVALIAIASGTGIEPEGANFVQTMAQPTTGIKDKNHVGLYRRATSPEELKSVFESLLTDINTCK